MNDKKKKSPLPAPAHTGTEETLPPKSGDFKAEDGASKPRPEFGGYTVAGKPQAVPPGLYPVATPIGNLRDITIRALDVLTRADVIACEDSRITKRLLNAYGIDQPLLVYHEHNAEAIRPRIMEQLARGGIVALVTDAGTPLVSDPGFKLVREAAAEGHKVYPIPGASAPIAALTGAGLPSDRFLFAGFPPSKQQARQAFLKEFSHIPATLIFFESPKRLKDSLKQMATLWPGRQAVVARELTKLYEEFRRDRLDVLAASYEAENTPKGEIVILVGPPDASETQSSEADLDQLLHQALESLSVRDASQQVAEMTGLKKKQVYSRALEIAREKDG
ncbi:16S rRNA (cytidine(1402)-2'-O)-methyltransferase [Aestuariispira insulae]|uniref:Ribosomal RNA small subunit methyltransferase I n=1 Tax=Aestuariispira insulae TaxID=1461337 RepID=A0A3D9HPM1_9PROT|nr:16S rRNA (cytidine(1402)-2'-O)-methyltransferase [Aestuariispira insulae]RED51438.1 16S rRNA (cytidine1402-2'-O)-methyltransferase [Aestuariispira insulae]